MVVSIDLDSIDNWECSLIMYTRWCMRYGLLEEGAHSVEQGSECECRFVVEHVQCDVRIPFEQHVNAHTRVQEDEERPAHGSITLLDILVSEVG